MILAVNMYEEYDALVQQSRKEIPLKASCKIISTTTRRESKNVFQLPYPLFLRIGHPLASALSNYHWDHEYYAPAKSPSQVTP
jgi:hypothetical protein